MTDPEDKRSVISRETLVPIGVAISCIVPIALGAMWIRDGMKDSEIAIKSLRDEMSSRFNVLESRTGDGWRVSDMERWVLRLERDNPTLKVPDVRK